MCFVAKLKINWVYHMTEDNLWPSIICKITIKKKLILSEIIIDKRCIYNKNVL